MKEIWEVVIGVVGCFAFFGLLSLIRRLLASVFLFVTKSRAPAVNDLDFENEHPLIDGGQSLNRNNGGRDRDPDLVDHRFKRDALTHG